jgi:CRISPR-associated protein Cas2
MHQKMRGFGYPLQYCLFRCELSETEKEFLKEALWDLMNWDQDYFMLIDLGPAGARGDGCIEFWGDRQADLPSHAGVIV